MIAYVFILVDEEHEKQAYEMMNFHKEHMREARKFLDPIQFKEKRKIEQRSRFEGRGEIDVEPNRI